MQVRGYFGNRCTSASCTLKAGGVNATLDKGLPLVFQVPREGLLEKTIVGMPAKLCTTGEKALQMFDKLPVQNVESWTALVAGSDKRTLSAKNVLMEMNAECGAPEKTRDIFDMRECRDLVSWNALITAYAQHGYGEQALDCLERMQQGGFSPNAVTFIGVLKACGSIGAVDKGQEIHAQIVRERLLDEHIKVGNALVHMYAKCDALEKAQDVFDELPVRNVVSWSVLIAGYAEHGHSEEALTCFEQMQARGGCSPDMVIFACILKACGSIGAAHKGQEVHADIVRLGWSADMVVGGALLVMYANCGMLLEAQEVFGKLLVRDVVAWTALMVGFSRLERDDIVLELYDKMLGEGLQPDFATLRVVSGLCSRRGLVDNRSLLHLVEHCSGI